MKKLLFLVGTLICFQGLALAADFMVKKEPLERTPLFEEKLASLIAQQINLANRPQEFLKSLEAKGSNESNTLFLKKLIDEKTWGEVPTATSDKDTIILSFSNGAKVRLALSNFWQNRYKINDYEVDLSLRKNPIDRYQYLQKVVQTKVLKEKKYSRIWFLLLESPAEARDLWNAVKGGVQARLPCNSTFLAGCIEVSMAATMWVSVELAEQQIIRDCAVTNIKESRWACMSELEKNDQVAAIRNISQFLARNPHIKDLEITCGKKISGVYINGEEIFRADNQQGFLPPQELDKTNEIGTRLAKLTDQCCEKSSDARFDGTCEKFINNHLGVSSKRANYFKGKKLKNNDKFYEGTR